MLILWLKALHVISLVTWFSALFYLPRLFVYHAMTPKEDEAGLARFKIMERKLYRGIMTPGMWLTLLFGFWLLAKEPFYWHAGWVHLKLLLVASLVIFHFYCGHMIKLFKEDKNTHGHVFYRWLNEYPTVILIAAVILAVVKPF